MNDDNPNRGGAAIIYEELPKHAQEARRKPRTPALGSPRPGPGLRRLASCGEPVHDSPSGGGNPEIHDEVHGSRIDSLRGTSPITLRLRNPTKADREGIK
jgi:hypothetical protein